MKWFKKPAVCSECGVHFEPAQGPHGSDLCSTHRRPVLELERRKAFVLAWAAQHWQELEEQALKPRNGPVAGTGMNADWISQQAQSATFGQTAGWNMPAYGAALAMEAQRRAQQYGQRAHAGWGDPYGPIMG